jgi:hypothetical protein
MKWIALSAFLFLAACAADQPQKSLICPGKFPAYWTKTSAPCELCDYNKIVIDKRGMVFWNQTPIDSQTLDQYLQLTTKMVPQPRIALDYPIHTPCQKVAEIRGLMEKRLECRNSYVCRAGPGPLGW